MTAFSLLLILVGIFILLNSANFVKVIKGEADINFLKPTGSGTTGTQASGTGATGPTRVGGTGGT